MFKFGKKRVLALATVAALAVAGIAYAYWTTTGSGSGSATNAASNGTLALHASFADGLTPGASEPVSFTADNTGTSNLYVGTVSSIVSTDKPACDVSWFSVPDAVVGQTIPHGQSGVALTPGSTITFADSTTANQDACKGAKVTLTLSSN
jgi:hypothetical protein